MEGFYDNETGEFIPGNSVEGEYELEPHEREAVAQIRKKVEQGNFQTRDEIMESVQLLESLNGKIENALKQEAQAASNNWTLKLRQEEILSLFSRLREEFRKHD